MLTLRKLILILTFSVSQFSFGADQCHGLFAENIQSLSPGVELQKVPGEVSNSVLKIEPTDYSLEPEAKALDLMRMIVQGPDEIIAIKNKITLGIPINKETMLTVTYSAKGMDTSRYVIDEKIVLSTVSKDFKIADGFLANNDLSLIKSTFDLPDFFEKNLHVNLQLPLSIEGQLLKNVINYKKYLQFIPKSNLRRMLNITSNARRTAALQIGLAKGRLVDALIKSPFKAISQGILMSVVAGATSFIFNNPHHIDPLQTMSKQSISIVENSINTIQIPSAATDVKEQLKAIKLEAHEKFERNETYKGPEFSEIKMDESNIFSKNHNTWIFEKVDPLNGSLHTFIVFSEEKKIQNTTGMQYFILEINANRYAALVAYIKNQGRF